MSTPAGISEVEQVSGERLQLAQEAWELRSRFEGGDSSVLDQLKEAEFRLDGRAWKVPAEELPGLEQELRKAVKRAERMGVMPPIFQSVAEEMVNVTSSSTGTIAARKVVLLILVGGEVSPSEGWRYLACLDHGVGPDGHNSVLLLSGLSGFDTEPYRSAEARCEHCNLKRNRKRSFLVESPDGKVRQVGSGCLSDYVGGSTAEQAARYAESLLDLTALLSAAEGKVKSLSAWGASDPSRTGFFDAEQYMGWVCRQVDKEGFVSRRQAFDSGDQSTADGARSALIGALQGSSADRPTPQQEAEGKAIISWARQRFSGNRSSLSEYEQKTASALDAPLVDYRSLPLLAGLYPAYQRDLQQQAARRASTSSHIGQVGDRVEVEAKVVGVSERETAYGLQRIYRLLDSAGNELSWFSTAADVLEEGDSYRLRGTVKRHDQFRGIPRTVLTRCRVL